MLSKQKTFYLINKTTGEVETHTNYDKARKLVASKTHSFTTKPRVKRQTGHSRYYVRRENGKPEKYPASMEQPSNVTHKQISRASYDKRAKKAAA